MPAVLATDKVTKPYTNPLALVGKPVKEKHAPKEVHATRALQARLDIDQGVEVDTGRAETFAAKMKAGEVFPPIKCMAVDDAPGFKGTTTIVVWDGMHTHAGAEIAKLKELDCLVWKGTWAQALMAAATVANREHENQGRALSTKEKCHSVEIMARGFKESDVPKKDWPSNRQIAVMIGCSHQHVNNIDPFGKSGSDNGAVKAKKRLKAAAAKGAAPAGPAPEMDPVAKKPVNQIVIDKSTGKPVAKYYAETPAKALERHKFEHPEITMQDFVTKEVESAAPVGAEKKPGYDWAGMDAHLGYLIRGLEGAKDMFDLAKTPEYKLAFDGLDAFAKQFNGWKKKHAGKTK